MSLPSSENKSAEEYEEDVRTFLLHGLCSPEEKKFSENWLSRNNRERDLASALRAEAREEESLSISRKALVNSRYATIIAIIAMIVSARSQIALIIEYILKKFFA